MKKFFKTSIAVMSLAGILALGLSTDALAAPKNKVEKNVKQVQIKKQLHIKNYGFNAKQLDVTGDSINDYVYLTGTKGNKDAIVINDVYLVVIDGKTKDIIKASIGTENTGSRPKLFIADFNKDKVKDILVTLDNRGIGATKINSLFTVKDGKLVALVNQTLLKKGLEYKVKYLPNFKVKVTNLDNKKSIILDAKEKKKAYIQNKVYNKLGKLLKEKSGAYDGIDSLEPVDVDKDGSYELVVSQKIWGTHHKDIIANMKSVIKIHNGKLTSK